LTLFLRQVGAPRDNNIVERSLKRAVLHRKNALFYRTLNGAQVGDLFMSLIHTCQLCGITSFDLPGRVATPCPGTGRPARRMDAVELSRGSGAKSVSPRSGGIVMNPLWPEKIVFGHREAHREMPVNQGAAIKKSKRGGQGQKTAKTIRGGL
jgi:hypothetical protein